MTTNIIVKAVKWPVEITTTDASANPDTLPQVATEVQAPNTEKTIYLTQTRSITLKELPEESK